MTNYNKSFNLRNGVQVDNTNFIVNSNGAVGIGSTVPTQILDVSGNINVSGFVTAPNLYTTLISAPSASITTVTAGIVTANYLYGDGSNLVNIPTSQWVNIDVGLGFTSIYAKGYVGITTIDPRFALQVGGNPNNSQSGVGIDSIGNIKATGIITANSFSGSGQNITSINGNNINSGIVSNSYLPSNISFSGIVTATGGFVGNVTGIASTALSLSGTPNITVNNITASNYYSTGILTSTTINGTSITVTNVNSGFSTTGILTAYTRLNATAIGVGTNSPNADIHIRDGVNGASLQLTTDGNFDTYVSIGRSVTRAGNNGELRFGNTNALYPYSTPSSLDIINYDIGNVNQYLQLGSPGVGTGSFNWFYGQSSFTPKMTFTYDGKLGIGITLPINQLHIVGTSTVTNNIYAGVDIYAGNNLYVANNLTVGGNFNSTTVSSNFIGNLSGNVNSTVGVSTFIQVGITTATIQSLGILNSPTTYPLEIGAATAKVVMNGAAIGINTNTILPGIGLDASNVIAVASGVGIGTTNPKSYVDFGNAGTGPTDFANARFMIPPKLTTTQRNALTTIEGGLIYNITLHRLELYNGTGWCGIATIP